VPRGAGRVCRTLLAFYARTARALGIPDGQIGTVTVIQRFGSGFQLNVHFHTLTLDGVFSQTGPGPLTFHPAPPPSDDDVAHVLATVRARVGQLLARRELEPEDDHTPADPLWHRLLGGLQGALSENGRLRNGDGDPEGDNRCRRVLVLATLSTRLLLPRCYQNTPYQDDPGTHPIIPDRFGLLRLGCLGCPEYVVRDNS